MKKQFNQKIIIVAIIFALFLSQSFLPYHSQAAGINLNWENPSAGRNPYQFKIKDIVSGDLMVQVLGCTGVVNKVSGIMVNLFRPKEYKKALEDMKNSILEAQCLALEMGLITSTGTIMNTTISLAPKELAERCEQMKVKNPELYNAAKEQLKIDEASKFREECLNGIAIALAKRQLTSITRSTMNWVASGFNGDPMYVQNINRYMDNITNRIINEEIELFKGADPYYYPYGRSYARSLISSNNFKNDVFGSLKLTLGDYLDFDYGYSDTYDYGYADDYNYGIVERYANDFGSGGWDGWLAFTQFDQNNPIGFNIMASDETQRKENEKTQEAEKEADWGDGMISQKKCVKSGLTVEAANKKAEAARAAEAVIEAQNKIDEAEHYYDLAGGEGNDMNDLTDAADILADARSAYDKALAYAASIEATLDDLEQDECKEWEIVTPGKIISETVTNYLNSPVRQLELADTINESLSILFDSLLNKFKKEGLTSLGQNTGDAFSNVSDGFAPNRTFDTSGNKITSNLLGGNGWDKPFDLTRDLGNTYIRDIESFKNLGNWDALNNIPELLPGKGKTNSYYIVSVAGKTKIINNAYNNWEIGDRAFFDGENWQNWKKPKLNQSIDLPIAKRGVLQIQQDYIASAMDFLTFLPSVMPKIGELDYCIPGPNPSWQANSSETQVAFSDFISALKADYTAGAFLKRDSVMINAPKTNSFEYRSYKNTFDRSNLWDRNYTEDIYEPFQLRGESNTASEYSYANSGTVQSTKPWGMIYAPVYDTTFGIYSGGAVYHRTTHGDWPDWKGNAGIADANNLVNDTIMNILTLFEKFNKEYKSLYDEYYGSKSKMQTQFILNEQYEVTYPNNSAYLPMASEGHSITRDILSHDEEISELTEEAKEAILTAKANILKLEEIKKEVSYIINEAQNRRDTEQRAKIIQDIMETNNVNETKAEEIYAKCKKQEEIYYIDANDLIKLNKNENRCLDSLDNDLDGYIDMNDADCNGKGNIDIGLRNRGVDDLISSTGNDYSNFDSSLNIDSIRRTAEDKENDYPSNNQVEVSE